MPKTQTRHEFPAHGGLTPHSHPQLTMTNDDEPDAWRLDGVPVLICYPDTKEPPAVIHKPSGSCWLTDADLTMIEAAADTWSPSEREWALIDRARDGDYDEQADDKGPISYILSQIYQAEQERRDPSGKPFKCGGEVDLTWRAPAGAEVSS